MLLGHGSGVENVPCASSTCRSFWLLVLSVVSNAASSDAPDSCCCAPCRALFSTDQSFPLTGAFAYSVYKFQNKRVKASPEGPFFGGNPMIGALLSTLTTLAIGVGVSRG